MILRGTFVVAVAATLVLANSTQWRTSYIGVVIPSSDSTILENLRPIFETYLSEQVGHNFSMVPLSRAKSVEALRKISVDFVFSDPYIFVCLESEFSGGCLIRTRSACMHYR